MHNRHIWLLSKWPLSKLSVSLIGLAAFLLYTATAAPGIVELFDDTLEFQVVGPTFGIAHPTGYPLYILLSGFWSRLLFPIGEWAWRMNIFSALTGAAAVALTAYLGIRLNARTPGLAWHWHMLCGLTAALGFGLGPVWWSQTTEAEVYALHLLFVTAILSLTLHIVDTQTQSAPDPLTRRGEAKAYSRVALLALLVGLALAHHRTIVLVAPGVGLILSWQIPRLLRPTRRWLLWLACLVLPLLLYLWIPLRAAMGVRDLHGSYEHTWQGFWDHVLARRYVAFFAENPLMVTRTPLEWAQLFIHESGLPLLALALLGLVAYPLVVRRLEPGWALMLITLLASLFFALAYRVGDVEVFLLPAFLCLALLASLGMGALIRLLMRLHHLRSSALAAGLAAALLIAITLGIGGRGPMLSRAQTWAAHDYAYLLATVDFPPHSRLIGLEGEITALYYMQLANGLGTNATGIVANLPPQREAAIAAAIAAGAPVFITRELENIEHLYYFSGAGPLIRVWPQPPQLPPLAHPVKYALEGAPLQLDAAAWNIRQLPGGPQLEITLDWRMLAPTDEIYKLSLRLLEPNTGAPHTDPNGQPIVADVFPLRQAALTPDWPLETPMRDVHYLPLPPSPTTAMQLQIIIYRADTLAETGRFQTMLP